MTNDTDDADYWPAEGSDEARRAVEAFWRSPEGRARGAEMWKSAKVILDAARAKKAKDE